MRVKSCGAHTAPITCPRQPRYCITQSCCSHSFTLIPGGPLAHPRLPPLPVAVEAQVVRMAVALAWALVVEWVPQWGRLWGTAP